MLLLVVKYIHILAAIVAVGLNISYAVWIVRARNNQANTPFALKGIKFLDDRIANPAFALLLVTGLVMVFLARYSLLTFWIDAALVLFVVLVVIAFSQYTPTLRRQVQLAEAGDTSSTEFQRLASRSQVLGQVLGVVVLVILAMMVFKPTL